VPLETVSDEPPEQLAWATLDPANGSGCAATETGAGEKEPLNPPGPPIAPATTEPPPLVAAAVADDESTTRLRATETDELSWTSNAFEAVGSSTHRLPPPALGAQLGDPAALATPAKAKAAATAPMLANASAASLFTNPNVVCLDPMSSLP
jgi:hypothetical protein